MTMTSSSSPMIQALVPSDDTRSIRAVIGRFLPVGLVRRLFLPQEPEQSGPMNKAPWAKAMAEFATSWTAMAASSSPAILVTSSTPLSVSSRWMTRAKRMANQIVSAPRRGTLPDAAAQGAEQGQGGEVGAGQGAGADTEVDRDPALPGPVDVLEVQEQRELIDDE